MASPALLAELERVLAYPKPARLVPAEDAEALIDWLRTEVEIVEDPDDDLPVRSPDPDDDYLIALSTHAGAALATGDNHLLDLPGNAPIYSPAAFLALLDPSPDS